MKCTLFAAMLAAGICCNAALAGAASKPAKKAASIDQIETIVVIYAENRSFDNLYGFFPGANGLQHVTGAASRQLDRDGSVMKELPPVWGGLTAMGVTPPVTEAQTQHLPNRPLAIDDPKGFNASLDVITRSPWHLFYQNQMQIDGGKNDKFVAYADTGSLVMGRYDTNANKLPLWNVARRYTLADNFFMGAFGESYLNHFWLICACTPKHANADQSPAKSQIAIVESDGVSLKLADNSPKSASDGLARSGDPRLAVCKAPLRRSHAVRYDLDPALHQQALRPAGAIRQRSTGRRAEGQRQQAYGRPHKGSQSFVAVVQTTTLLPISAELISQSILPSLWRTLTFQPSQT